MAPLLRKKNEWRTILMTIGKTQQQHRSYELQHPVIPQTTLCRSCLKTSLALKFHRDGLLHAWPTSLIGGVARPHITYPLRR